MNGEDNLNFKLISAKAFGNIVRVFKLFKTKKLISAELFYDYRDEEQIRTWDKAIKSAWQYINFDFSDKTYAIRRNLLAACSIAIASTFVDSIEKVNFGLVSGAPINTVVIYWALCVVVFYYCIWLYLYGRSQVITNLTEIENGFFKSLAISEAQAKYADYVSAKNEGKRPTSVPIAFELYVQGESTVNIIGRPSDYELNEVSINERMNELDAETSFVTHSDTRGIPYVIYKTVKRPMDHAYLNIRLDSLMLHGWKNVFVFKLPFFYALLTLILLALKIGQFF
jgi:hypothetical protein